jgi:hypothetical protein
MTRTPQIDALPGMSPLGLSAFKPGTYVIDTSDSGRYNRAVYSVVGQSFDRSIVRYVGSVVNGRIEYDRNQPITHRTTSALKEWK